MKNVGGLQADARKGPLSEGGGGTYQSQYSVDVI